MKLMRNSWTKQECHEKALLCKSKSEFLEKYNKHYQKAIRQGWINEICFHMNIKINQYDYDRIIYVYIFEKTKSIYVGLTKNFKYRHYSRLYKNNDCVMEHIKETSLTPKIKFLTNFISAELAQIKEQEFIDKFRSDGWNILNKQKAGSLGGSIILKNKL